MSEEKNKKDNKEKETEVVNETVSEDNAKTTQKNLATSGGNNKMLLVVTSVVIALVLVGGTLYMTGTLPFLGGTTDNSKVVATVNGEKITRVELDARILQNKTSYEAQGADLSDPATYSEIEKQALDFMINEELILQDTEARNISVTSEEVDAQFEATAGNFESEQAFEEALKDNGLTRDILRENIKTQLTVQKYFDEVISSELVVVSEEEVNNFYTEYKAQNPEAPELEELKPQIEELLRDQKTQGEVEKILAELKDGADVQIMLE
ncbi:MAG: SurA N-terminal domain-containing protein [Candidatus Spechtbacterales bacterium]